MTKIVLALGLATWALALGPGCGWEWSSDPRVFVQWTDTAGVPDCDGDLALAAWGEGAQPNTVLVRRLRHGDCVGRFDVDRWHLLYLVCERDGAVDASPLIDRVELGAKGAARRASCLRFVEAPAPAPRSAP